MPSITCAWKRRSINAALAGGLVIASLTAATPPAHAAPKTTKPPKTIADPAGPLATYPTSQNCLGPLVKSVTWMSYSGGEWKIAIEIRDEYRATYRRGTVVGVYSQMWACTPGDWIPNSALSVRDSLMAQLDCYAYLTATAPGRLPTNTPWTLETWRRLASDAENRNVYACDPPRA